MRGHLKRFKNKGPINGKSAVTLEHLIRHMFMAMWVFRMAHVTLLDELQGHQSKPDHHDVHICTAHEKTIHLSMVPHSTITNLFITIMIIMIRNLTKMCNIIGSC